MHPHRERELSMPTLGGVKVPGVEFSGVCVWECRYIKWFDVARR